ncbi:type II toxin-antitoxin system HicB family antitoxin [Bordetella genomosp. 1]|nr:type II toxin-antitoxin system HicB family antitoxin [Bordetella genomosp. 1]
MRQESSMRSPLHIQKAVNTAYGASFPDFPGCFAAADKLRDLPRAAQEAVEAHLHGEGDAIPAPSTPEAWVGHADFKGGFWMMVDIDLSRIGMRAVRPNTK